MSVVAEGGNLQCSLSQGLAESDTHNLNCKFVMCNGLSKSKKTFCNLIQSIKHLTAPGFNGNAFQERDHFCLRAKSLKLFLMKLLKSLSKFSKRMHELWLLKILVCDVVELMRYLRDILAGRLISFRRTVHWFNMRHFCICIHIITQKHRIIVWMSILGVWHKVLILIQTL